VLFQRLLEANAHRLASGVVYTRAVVYTKKLESDFARWLRDLHHANPELRIGSYPWVDGGALTKITVEGLDVDVVRQAVVDITREVDGFDVISP